MATPSEDLQKVVRDAIVAVPSVGVGERVFDRRPNPSDFPCITFGPQDADFEDMDCISARMERLQLDIWTRDGGRVRTAKAICDRVKAVLHRQSFDMQDHALAELEVIQTRAFMDPDGLTAHGVVIVQALIEER